MYPRLFYSYRKTGKCTSRSVIGALAASAIFVFVLAAAESSATGTIGGTITSAVSGMPLAFADVNLLGSAGNKIVSLKSDRRGQFLFTGVPPGEYRLSASRRYFATGRYGQRTWNGIGALIELDAGRSFEANLALHRLGVITGMILDENGEGMPHYPVRAIRVRPQNLSGPVSFRAVSDDRGYFRIPGLKPGNYHVATVENGAPGGGYYLPTYHPGVLDRTQSPPVRAELDSETPGIAVRAMAGDLLSLSGSVTVPDGENRLGISLQLFLDEQKREARPSADGSFHFRSLPPGRYTLAAVTEPGGGPALAAYQQVDLFRDVAGLQVRLEPAPKLSITVDSGARGNLESGQILVMLSRVENYGRSAPREARRGAGEGRFESGPLLPGEWRPFVIAPERYFVDEITVDGKDALEGIRLMPGAEKTARVKLGTDPGTVSGRVLDDKGRAVPAAFAICYPLDPKNRLRLAGYRKMQANEKGEYRFGGLPPGNYIFAGIAFIPDEIEEQLTDLIASIPVTRVEGGSTIELDLTVRP